jgi:SAM-dependent methyltransferase
MPLSSLLESWLVRWGRLGFTDIYHDNVKKRGALGQLYVLLLGTPHLGSFANGIYLKRAIKARQFASVLDAGSGDGTFAFYLASRLPGSKIVGVDIGEQGLHGVENTLGICDQIQARLAFPNLEFRQADLRALGFQDAFDFIYSFDVLEHIPENKQVLSNLYRALKKDGLLLFRIPTRVQKRILPKRFTAQHEKWAAVEHLGQHYDRDELLKDLQEIGFRVISLDYTMGFWGKLSFELLEGMRAYHFPEVVQFAMIPMLKTFRFIDTKLHPRDGDGLLALCRK